MPKDTTPHAAGNGTTSTTANGHGNHNNNGGSTGSNRGSKNKHYPNHARRGGGRGGGKFNGGGNRPKTSTALNNNNGNENVQQQRSSQSPYQRQQQQLLQQQFQQQQQQQQQQHKQQNQTNGAQSSNSSSRQRGAAVLNEEECPWKDWSLYFPQEDYHASHEYIPWIGKFVEYFCSLLPSTDDGEALCQKLKMEIERKNQIVVNFRRLIQECEVEQLEEAIIHQPMVAMGCLALAALQVIYGAGNQRRYLTNNNHNNNHNISTTTTNKRIEIRFIRFDRQTRGKDLKANLIGKLVSVRGTVVRTSGVKPLATRMSFTCNSCHLVQTLDFPDAKFQVPKSCPEIGCKSKNFTQQRGVGYETETVDWQTIRLQEKLPDDRSDSGRVPRTIDCEARGDMVDLVIPGDVVEITGIVKVVQSDEGNQRNKTGNTMYLLYLDVNYINRTNMNENDNDPDDDEDGMEVGPDAHQSQHDSSSQIDTKDNIQITTKDLYAIEEVHMEPQLFKLIVNSFCPSIFGHEMVKAGILLALFGGKRQSNNKNHQLDRTAIRADPHVLIVGDPGLGKSQMLSAAVKVAPRGVYVCGSSGISTSGLTVTLVRGTGSEFALEAGALVLGDQGCCCIDEFDKMTTDHNALLEAMEQQTISIAKAGIICTLPARTSVIAAANPVGGHYNMSKSVAENLKMNTALLSRFDLIFILMDKPDGEMDQYLSRHVMALHSGGTTSGLPPTATVHQTATTTTSATRGSSSSSTSISFQDRDHYGLENDTANISMDVDEDEIKMEQRLPLYERLRITDQDNLELIPLPLLRKYIAYARKYVHPRLSLEASRVLQEFYLILRAKHRSPDGTPVTTRQLESMIRMSEAKARMECREMVTKQDAMDVIEIVSFSLYDAFENRDGSGNSGGGLFSGLGNNGPERGPNGGTKRGQGKNALMKKFIAELQKVAFSTSNHLFSYSQMSDLYNRLQLPFEGGFSALLESINDQGFLMKKGGGVYQLSAVM